MLPDQQCFEPLADLFSSHRLSTIINANRIIVIKDGSIVEQGSHEELIRAKGKYADLWAKQVFLKPRVAEMVGDQVVAEGSKTLSVVNDLTVELTESELAKAREPTTPTTPRDSTMPKLVGDDKGSGTAGHVREVHTS